MRLFSLLILALLPLASVSLVHAQDAESTPDTLAAEEAAPEASESVSEAADTETIIEEEPAEENPVVKLREESELLRTESGLRELQIKAELADQIAETQRLQIEAAHRRAKLQEELSELQTERDTLKAEMSLRETKAAAELAELSQANQRLEQELKNADLEARQGLAEITRERERLKVEFSLREQRLRDELSEKELERLRTQSELAMASDRMKIRELEIQAEKQELLHEAQKIDLARKKLQAENERAAVELVRLKQKLELRNQEKQWKRAVEEPLEYPAEPFDGTALAISDRRIALNGPIITGTANYITQRIHFFNNQDDDSPIFIVIDSSPGGSVMEGYRILKAMEASSAPIHVVVKSFAASMAAVILTMAEESYAFPNAVILHHQPWSFSVGNITQQSEQMEIFKDWAKRLHQPVADKMGVTLEEFYTEMYENNSMGDWQEFADKAQELKWVDHITLELREEGITEKPTGRAPRPFFFFFAGDDGELVPEEGLEARIPRSAMLPAPDPFDFYFLYNRMGFYRWPNL
ncbi:MAG: ATP-dependent Clp protease proteolytic subunit [Opitutales bacterium]